MLFTLVQGASKPGLNEGVFLFRGPKQISPLSSVQCVCFLHGMVKMPFLAAVLH